MKDLWVPGVLFAGLACPFMLYAALAGGAAHAASPISVIVAGVGSAAWLQWGIFANSDKELS